MEVSSVFDAAMFTHVDINANMFMNELIFWHVCALFGTIVAHCTLSPVRVDRDIPAEMRGGDGSSKGVSRWPGRMGIEKKCVSGLIVPLMSLQAVTPLCGTPHYPSVRVR